MHVEVTFDKQTTELLKKFLAVFNRIADATEGIQKNTAPSPYAVEFQLLLGGLDMKAGSVFGGSKGRFRLGTPVPITDAPAGQKIAVVGTDAQGALGAPLQPGASIVITAANGATGKVAAAFTPDPTAGTVSYIDANGVQQTNVQALITGILAAAQPIDANDPFVVTYAITNADGTAGNTGSGTAQIVPGTESSEVLVLQGS